MNIQTNEFVKWTSKDHLGTFSHIGQLMSKTDELITIKLANCIVMVKPTDGTFEKHKPVVLTSAVEVEETAKPKIVMPDGSVAKAKKVYTKLEGGATKAERALELYKANPNATRKELIEMFMSQLGMSAAGASTYASNVKKA